MHRPICISVFLVVLRILWSTCAVETQEITVGGQPAQLDIREAGEHSIRVTLKPLSYEKDFPFSPALANWDYSDPAISIRELKETVKARVGNLNVEVRSVPLSVIVTNLEGNTVQELIFRKDGKLSFKHNHQPVLGMGEGGPKPSPEADWRDLPVEFDRRGRYHHMQPRWQRDAYGSRNPVAVLIGIEGWGLFVATPWVEVDLQDEDRGLFIPWERDFSVLQFETPPMKSLYPFILQKSIC